MQKPEISVIVPVYNVEKYLNQCLNSIKGQTLTSFEVICLNDGSTDNSLNILEQYAAADSRFKIIDKQNSGYGHSMNIGLAAAQGKYIAIIESDDYAEPEMLATLYNMAESNELDIGRGNYYQLYQGKKTKADLHYIPQDKIICPLEYPAVFYQAPAIWASLYNAAFLKQNAICFLETPGASYQDTSFAFKAYALCRRFMFKDIALINYRMDNPNSSVNSAGKAFAVCTEYKEILSFARRHDHIYSKIKNHIPVIRYACYAWNLGRLAPEFRMQFLKKWSREIKRDYKEGRNPGSLLSKKRRKRTAIIRYFPYFYRWRKKAL